MGKKCAAMQGLITERRSAHDHTNVLPTGLGQRLSSTPGKLAKGPLEDLSMSHPVAKWAPPAVAPCLSPSNPAAAVELEIARAAALDQLRHKLASLCAKAGLRNVPLLAFERWRFTAKWAEDEPSLAGAAAALSQHTADLDAQHPQQTLIQLDNSSSKKSKTASGAVASKADPVLPYGSLPPAAEPGLVQDLVRAGLQQETAAAVALQLAQAAAAAATVVTKRRHQLASGKAPSVPELVVAFHKHSLDFTCGSKFVKVSRAAYGKLSRLYRKHMLTRLATDAAALKGDSSIGLPLTEASVKMAELEAAAADVQLGCSTQAAERPSKRQKQDAASTASATAAGRKSMGMGGGDDKGEGLDVGSGSDNDAEGDGASGFEGTAHGAAAGGDVYCEARIAELEAASADANKQQLGQQEQQGQSESAGTSSRSSGEGRTALHYRMFALLLRYKSIQGHGFQAAAGPPVFELLRRRMALGFECFASPLNAHFERYGSAFPDVDGPFGSAGSIFRMQLKHGSYEANPPFVPTMLTATAIHITRLLQQAEAAQQALSFVVLMPGWEEVEGWQMLRSSPFLTKSLLVAADDHGYCDGASHQRRDLYRQSPYDSGIMFLQTKAAAVKWPVGEQQLEQVRQAMASCCPSAAAAERQKKQRGMKDLEVRGVGVPVQKLPAATVGGDGAAAGNKLAGMEGGELQQTKGKKKKKKRKGQDGAAAVMRVHQSRALQADGAGEAKQQLGDRAQQQAPVSRPPKKLKKKRKLQAATG